MKRKKGATVVEMLIGVAILAILTAISVSVFSSLSNSTSLERDAGIVLNYIETARTMAINSVDSEEHGIYLETGKVSIFKGTTYSASAVESFYELPGKSKIGKISLSGGASSFYFAKLSGYPSATGTISVTDRNNTATTTITIYGTGLAEIE